MNWRAVVVALAVASPARAQSGNEGAIEGTVTDSTRAVIVGAIVVARNQETAARFSALTDAGGGFRFLVLPVGRYEVSAEHPGFARFRRGVLLTVGAKVSLPIVLDVGTRQASVSVEAERPLVEATRTSFSSTIEQRAVFSLPLFGRNFVNLVLLTPGITGAPGGIDGGFFSAAGQASMNSLLVDGADQNGFTSAPVGSAAGNRYLFSQEAVQEFQVNTASYSSEFGRAGTAVVNVVTKSGTNRWQGSAFWYYRDDALTSTGPIQKRDGEPKAPFEAHQLGATAGGPVLRDRLFFFASYDGQRRYEENQTVLNLSSDFSPSSDPEVAKFQKRALEYLQDRAAPYERRFVQDVVLGKLDWRAGRNSLFASWNRHRFGFSNAANMGPAQSLEHTGPSKQIADSVAVSLTSQLGSTSVNVARFSYVGNHDPQGANTSLPEADVFEGSRVLLVGRSARLPVDTGVWRGEWADTVSLGRGPHALKIGGSVIAERARFFSAVNFYGAYRFESLERFGRSLSSERGMASRYTQAFSAAGTPPIDVYPNYLDAAGFAQDSWRLHSQLTVDIGLRYEVQVMRQSPVRNTSPALEAAGIDTSYIPTDGDNLAPRTGFAWTPGQSQRLVVRGGYGLYYPRFLPATAARVFFQNGITVQTRTFSGLSIPAYPETICGPSDPSGAPPACRTPVAGADTIMAIPRSYQQPVIRQGSFGAQYAVSSNLTVSATYLYAAGDQLLHWQDVNLAQPEIKTIGIKGTDTLLSYRRYPSRPIGGFDRILLLKTNGSSRYHGLALQANKRYSHGFQLEAAYTLGRVIDDNPTLGGLNPGPGDSALLSDSMLPALDRGEGDLGQRHRAVASGVWELPGASDLRQPARAILSGWQLSGLVAAESGHPYSGFVNYDLNHDGNASTDRAPGVPRNSFFLPATVSVDLRVTRRFHVTRRLSMQASLDAFNLFNRANIDAVSTTQFAYEPDPSKCGIAGPCLVPQTEGDTAFGAPTAALNARTVQLSVKLLF
jgi:hypothetical protein